MRYLEGYLFRGREKPQGQRPVWDENLWEPYLRHLGYFRGRPPERGTCMALSFLGTFDHRWRANCAAWTFFPRFFILVLILNISSALR